jgi:hypothetical protein
LIWQRRSEERVMEQTIAYLTSAAFESNVQQKSDSRLIMRTADFTDYKAMLDNVAPCPPNGDLVAYDTILHEHTERSIANLFPQFASAFLQPVAGPASQWLRHSPDGSDWPAAVAAPPIRHG